MLVEKEEFELEAYSINVGRGSTRNARAFKKFQTSMVNREYSIIMTAKSITIIALFLTRYGILLGLLSLNRSIVSHTFTYTFQNSLPRPPPPSSTTPPSIQYEPSKYAVST